MFFVLCTAIGASYYLVADGLSIPFFNLGRGVQSGTAAFSYTWTRTISGGTLPDWVFYARRPRNGADAVGVTTIDVDVESGMETHVEAVRETETRADQAGIGLSSKADVTIPVATVQEVDSIAVISDRSHCSGGGDEATEVTQVRFPVLS